MGILCIMSNSENLNELNNEKLCCLKDKKKLRDEKEKRDLINRLKRIEGQVRGIENMIENDSYCTDVLTQVSAISSALNSFNNVLLEKHIRTCVSEDIRNGNEEVITDLMVTIKRLMK